MKAATLLRFLIGVLFFAFITPAIGRTSETPVSSINARNWRADLYYMAYAITRYHKNAFIPFRKGSSIKPSPTSMRVSRG
jgi:hypothetical protein